MTFTPERLKVLGAACMAPESHEEAYIMLTSLCRRLSLEKLKREVTAAELAATGATLLTVDSKVQAMRNLNTEVMKHVVKLREKLVSYDLHMGADPHKSEFKEIIVTTDINTML